jgi:DnaJ-class molecular chaperone
MSTIDTSNNIIQRSTEKQCKICLGVGLVKKEVIICSVCDGIKCMYCNSSGYEQYPYEPCTSCDGLGTQIAQRIKIKIKND